MSCSKDTDLITKKCGRSLKNSEEQKSEGGKSCVLFFKEHLYLPLKFPRVNSHKQNPYRGDLNPANTQKDRLIVGLMTRTSLAILSLPLNPHNRVPPLWFEKVTNTGNSFALSKILHIKFIAGLGSKSPFCVAQPLPQPPEGKEKGFVN